MEKNWRKQSVEYRPEPGGKWKSLPSYVTDLCVNLPRPVQLHIQQIVIQSTTIMAFVFHWSRVQSRRNLLVSQSDGLGLLRVMWYVRSVVWSANRKSRDYPYTLINCSWGENQWRLKKGWVPMNSLQKTIFTAVISLQLSLSDLQATILHINGMLYEGISLEIINQIFLDDGQSTYNRFDSMWIKSATL